MVCDVKGIEGFAHAAEVPASLSGVNRGESATRLKRRLGSFVMPRRESDPSFRAAYEAGGGFETGRSSRGKGRTIAARVLTAQVD